MTNIKYLKENNLYEAHQHFMQLCESYPSEMEEAGEDDPNAQQDPNMMGGAPGGMPGADPMGGGAPGADPNAMGGDPNAMGGAPGGDPNAMGGQDMGADPNAMGQPMPDASDPMGDDLGGEDPFADQRTGDDDLGGDDTDGDTIDIDGLTKAEEKLNDKQNQVGRDLAKVDTKISNLIDKIAGLQSALDSNSSELESLKAEFEKRNPTQTEKLDIRGALDSYPFNVRPDDFWANKMKERGNYEVYADNDKSTEDQYTITDEDVENLPSDISKTFSIDDDDIQTLEKMFKL
ncbi:MAG: hypothetical protein J6O49_18230 [Bacteroidaceae bacterium]|nr:hypothetical protein [Bacteroidaceae bacterium]